MHRQLTQLNSNRSQRQPARRTDGDRPVSLWAVPVWELCQQTLLPQASILLPFGCVNSRSQPLRVLVVGARSLVSSRNSHPDSIGCLAEVSYYGQPSTGHYWAMLKGVSRVRYHLQTPLADTDANAADGPRAVIEMVADEYPVDPIMDPASRRQQLISWLLGRCPELAICEMSFLLECELPLGQLCDLAAGALGLSAIEQAEILQELRVDMRCRRLLEISTAIPSSDMQGLPAFGIN